MATRWKLPGLKLALASSGRDHQTIAQAEHNVLLFDFNLLAAKWKVAINCGWKVDLMVLVQPGLNFNQDHTSNCPIFNQCPSRFVLPIIELISLPQELVSGRVSR